MRAKSLILKDAAQYSPVERLRLAQEIAASVFDGVKVRVHIGVHGIPHEQAAAIFPLRPIPASERHGAFWSGGENTEHGPIGVFTDDDPTAERAELPVSA